MREIWDNIVEALWFLWDDRHMMIASFIVVGIIVLIGSLLFVGAMWLIKGGL